MNVVPWFRLYFANLVPQPHVFARPSILLNCDVRKSEKSLWHQSSRIYLQDHPY